MIDSRVGYTPFDGDPPDGAGRALRRAGPRQLRAILASERERTLRLCAAYADALGPGLRVPLHPGLNPPLWEWGHLAWFEQWWIARNPQRALGAACDPLAVRAPSELAQADAWYDSSRVPHAHRWELPLPGLPETLAWLARTREETLVLLDALPDDAPAADLYFFRLVAAHEAMHAEAACYMARALGFPLTPDLPDLPHLRGPADPALGPAELALPSQVWRLGSDSQEFCFDNELQAHPVPIEAFRIDARPVSWSRLAEFARAGGYDDPRAWTPDGWAWRQQALPARVDPPDSCDPAVHVSAHEADAWCRWAGRRLPTEAEWECAAHHAPGFAWGAVWEWTASEFQPYPGFMPHPYRDYSAPWFGSRRVLRGACAATSPILVHPRFRNFFEPGRRDVFAGFRSCA